MLRRHRLALYRFMLVPVLATVLLSCGGSDGGTGPVTGDGPKVAILHIQAESLVVAQRGSVQLEVVARDAYGVVIPDPALEYQVGPGTVQRVTVSATGLIQGTGPGGPTSVTVRPVGTSATLASVPVTVLSIPNRVLLSPDSMTMVQGSVGSVQVVVRDTLGYIAFTPTITHEILDTMIASVGPTGAIAADGKAGTTRYRVTASRNGTVASAEIPLVVLQDAFDIHSPGTVHVPEGGSTQVTLTIFDRAGDPIALSDLILQSQAPELFSISGDATITSLAGPGSGTVRVYMPYNKAFHFSVVVDPAP